MVTLSSDELLAIRLRNQGIVERSATGVLQTVQGVGALQAQSTHAVRLAVRVRSHGLTAAEVDDEIAVTRSVVRATLMRGTIHLVATEDLRWMADLVGPTVRAQTRRRREQLGLTDALCAEAFEVLPELLADAGAVALGDVMDMLAERGVVVDRSAQAPSHLMLLAASHGLVCRGLEVGRTPTFALTATWAGSGTTIDRDEALARLAQRFLAGRGPATVTDFRTWSGLSAADCTLSFAHIAEELVQVRSGGESMVALTECDLDPPATPAVRLLGMWDEVLLSHANRDHIVDPESASRILVGGVIQSAVLVNGRAAGVWRLVGSGGTRRLLVDAFTPFDNAVREALDVEVTDLGRFLDIALRLDLMT